MTNKILQVFRLLIITLTLGHIAPHCVIHFHINIVLCFFLLHKRQLKNSYNKVTEILYEYSFADICNNISMFHTVITFFSLCIFKSMLLLSELVDLWESLIVKHICPLYKNNLVYCTSTILHLRCYDTLHVKAKDNL